jgi:hypothetical protein
MITEAQTAANQANAAFSTGPKTEAGKASSSKNALTFGLFTMSDFVRDNEAEEYTKICTSLWKELTPEGTLEQNFTTEIVSATWRLRRCRMADETLGGISVADPLWSDPMLNPATEKQQKSVDRARAQSQNALRRSIAELRKLQTERTAREELELGEDLGVTDSRQACNIMIARDRQWMTGRKAAARQSGAGGSACPGRDREAERSSATPASAPPQPDVTKESIARPYPNSGSSEDRQPLTKESIARSYPGSDRSEDEQPLTKESMARSYPGSDRSEDQQPLVVASFCKPAVSTPAVSTKFPRNAPCHCGSGQKYKRCCGRNGTGMPGLPQTKPDSELTTLVNAPAQKQVA